MRILNLEGPSTIRYGYDGPVVSDRDINVRIRWTCLPKFRYELVPQRRC
eukprot:SAG31_NODE_24737_length_475_cov_0.776596_1_plen_48_part_10